MTEVRLKHAWSRTFVSAHYDFKAEDPDGVVFGRIRRLDYGPQQGRWEWHMNDDRYTASGVAIAGFEVSKKTAALAVEAAFEEARRRCLSNEDLVR
ncbi:hypothetical protein [Rhizobium sp. G21]|uniref:hypothetical protein n=1 Tax=Rhizobium sp. G21 TaxID=2758439 RepID=UPI0015FFD406|nr:hypothetical protein [Rhizobium sp. G21]MBB1247479.1 hypothetical protein [Rhizobium sp. G21]